MLRETKSLREHLKIDLFHLPSLSGYEKRFRFGRVLNGGPIPEQPSFKDRLAKLIYFANNRDEFQVKTVHLSQEWDPHPEPNAFIDHVSELREFFQDVSQSTTPRHIILDRMSVSFDLFKEEKVLLNKLTEVSLWKVTFPDFTILDTDADPQIGNDAVRLSRKIDRLFLELDDPGLAWSAQMLIFEQLGKQEIDKKLEKDLGWLEPSTFPIMASCETYWRLVRKSKFHRN